MNTNPNVSEEVLEAAAVNVLGADTAPERAGYGQTLTADPAARKLDRDLRRTVAIMAAASPHMKPPESLRGKILQATAPTTFKMEDYRKATHETGRFYRWGFYAAMAFLMLGAYYNISLQTKLKSAGQQMNAQTAQLSSTSAALAAFVNPGSDQIRFTDGKNHTLGEAFVNASDHTAVVILPDNVVPADKTVNLSLPENGKSVAYKTILVRVPAGMMQGFDGQSINSNIAVTDMRPDSRHVMSAQIQ